MSQSVLSIIIPTYNESKDIKLCLESIACQKIKKNKIEVILVDNYSTDDTISIVKSFSKKINIRVIFNKVKDAEVSKMKGFLKAKGDFFMYLDADMVLSDENFVRKMTFPLEEDDSIVGVFIRFLVNPTHHPLTRTLSYDEWQRDPIFKYFTTSIKEIIVEKRKNYFFCALTREKIPPQGLMIYRRNLIIDYVSNETQLIDNEIPAVLFNMGYTNFAYVPETGVYHHLLRSLAELYKKRIRNLQRTYFPNKKKRLFKWINWNKDLPKIGIWLIYTNSIILPIFVAMYHFLKYRDLCFFNEPVINLVSTYSIIFGVLNNAKNKK